MRKTFTVFLVIVLVATLVGCNGPSVTASTGNNVEAPVQPVLETPVVLTTIPQIPTETTVIPTSTLITQLPTKNLTTRELWIAQHEEQRVQFLEEQGPAETIPALEYHGNEYSMDFGSNKYELTKEAFDGQMKWFFENHVHAVTGDELIQWISGKIQLPKKSVILTFDLVGNRDMLNIPEILETFEEYKMHGIFNIWSGQMEEGDSYRCAQDACWQVFRDAYNSGTATIASHSIDHLNFGLYIEKAGLRELKKSKESIESHIGEGSVVNVMSWPFESVPEWKDSLATIGFEIAFGGNTYSLEENAVRQDKIEDRYRLPRVLPPNSNGISIRPAGRTLEQMMDMYWDIGN